MVVKENSRKKAHGKLRSPGSLGAIHPHMFPAHKGGLVASWKNREKANGRSSAKKTTLFSGARSNPISKRTMVDSHLKRGEAGQK